MTSSSSSRVALIVGAGSNIGASLVKGFLAAGYRVVTVSRSNPATTSSGGSSNSRNNEDDSHHVIQADASDPSSIPRIFADLSSAKKDWAFPSVIVWNAASLTTPAAADNPLGGISLEALDRDLGLMIASPFLAAQTAIEVWEETRWQEKRKGTFIMTGNMLPRKIPPMAQVVTLGIGKSGANFWVGLTDLVLKDKGIRFFFADERLVDGGASVPPNGESHAHFFLSLTKDDKTPSYATFVDGEYREFCP